MGAGAPKAESKATEEAVNAADADTTKTEEGANSADAHARTTEEAVVYSLGSLLRVEALAALNERVRTNEQLAQLLGVTPQRLSHHIKALRQLDAIEIAFTEPRGNATAFFYRAIKQPYYSDEEMAAKPFEERQQIYGTILRSVMSESLAALSAGKISNDFRAWLSWRWFNVDAQGRDEIADEQEASWRRVQEIEARSMTRHLESGEQLVSVIVSSLGHERARTSITPPMPFSEDD